MVDRISVTDSFGKKPRDGRRKSFRENEDWENRARYGSPRTFVSPKELEDSMRHPTWSDALRKPEDWRVSFTVPRPNFLQKTIVDFIQWVLGDSILIIDRSRIVDIEKYQHELEELWSQREAGTISKPTVIQLQIALEDKEDPPAEADPPGAFTEYHTGYETRNERSPQ